MVLSDGTTLSQLAAVDASGRLSVNLTASSATVTVDSELPAAAALADGAANPTAPAVGAFGMLWNSATWDRQPGNAAGGAFVQGNLAADAPITARPLPGGGRASSAVPTAMSGDGDAVHVWLDRSGGTIVNGRDAHDAALDANTNPQLIGGRSSVAAPTDVSADGDAVRAWFLRNGAQAVVVTSASGIPIPGEATNGLDVDVTRVTGTVTVDSELPAAAALSDAFANPTAPGVGAFAMLWNSATWDRAKGAATLADALANPGTGLAMNQVFLMGYNGTTWDRVRTANTGRLQVDVVTGGSADTPTSPINLYGASSGTAAGATSNLDTSDFGAATKKCTKVIFGSSVPMKAELQYVDNSVGTTLAVGFSPAGGMGELTPPGDRTGRNYWSHTFSATAGLDGFRVIRTNLDASEAADLYATICYED
jgi:hypothetical protein